MITKCDFDESILKMNLDADDEPKEHVYHWPNLGTYPCSSLVEGDEQLDWPNYGMMPCMCIIIFFGFNINRTAFFFGQYCLHLLLLKSSTIYLSAQDL